MAWQVPLTSLDGPRIELGEVDNLYIAAQVVIVQTGQPAFDALGFQQRVVIHGSIIGLIGGIMGGSTTTDFGHWLTVGKTGQLQSLAGVGFVSLGSCRIDNAGSITGFDGDAISIVAEPSVSNISKITNSGLIDGQLNGITVNCTDLHTVQLYNSGTITGEIASYSDISTFAQIDTITNLGLMKGDVLLGLGDDLIDSRSGTIQGLVDGGAGNDRLYTGVGNDQLYGGDGNDILMGGAGGDLYNGGFDADTVTFFSSTSGVSASLALGGQAGDARGDIYFSIETLIGSSFNDTLVGDTSDNRLLGGAGNDILAGGLGKDILYGQAGRDVFVFDTAPDPVANYDRIMDYVVLDDIIRLDDAAFSGIGPVGILASNAFLSNTTGIAADAFDRLIYNTTNGALYFDSNGTGLGGRVLMAFLPTGLNMANTEFAIV
jgi:Ca2+-binding RTX toxin-like protein